ncbi:MAG TPA: glycosyl hydrolase [Chitinophagaceae bacterium]|nr:glycosyl hydrolase [Chitinophagaceae bacterium]
MFNLPQPGKSKRYITYLSAVIANTIAMNIKRRRFIKLASLGAASSLPLLSTLKSKALPFAHTAGSNEDDAMYEMFINPQNYHKPFVRWWWNGDRVTKEEALRELDIMKEAGIGGVEINPIKWNENADDIGIKELVWGSTEWLDVVEATVKGAKEKGIICDMIVGSGWPFGGEHVPRAEQSQIIILGTKNLEGGHTYTFNRTELINSIEPPSNYENKVNELFMLRLAPAVMNDFTPGTSFNGLVNNETISIPVPEGKHVLYYLVKVTGFQRVIQGALGAKGPVINHYDRAAVQNYLDNFGELLTGRLGALDNYFRAFFTDSIELEGANWCNDMFEQFKQRKGYDIEEYFPYILFKVGEMGNAVNEKYGSEFSTALQENINRARYDFLEVKQAIFEERFVGTFTAWCRKHNVKSRMQAYGMDCNAIDASMQLDIPECETWIWVPEIEEFDEKEDNFSGRNYTMINKFVSSAGHFSGKQVISCEEMTNTGQIFCTTLERVKVTGDQSNLSGVTHSILHGFNYSPLQAPFPGWLRYGSFFNERNTWWPYFKLWSAYKARLSSVLQNSVMQADIAILHPLADLASKYGFQRDPFPRVSYPKYVHKVWEAVHQNGNGCDYISEKVLQRATMNNGTINFNARSYKALILIEVETISPETAEALKRFADAGGKIIFIAKTPHLSSGMVDYRQKSAVIESISKAILANHPKTTGIVPAPGKDLITWFKAIQHQYGLAPYITVTNPVIHVSQLHYKDGDRDIFYFTNYSSAKEHTLQAVFNSGKTAWLWNTETGERLRYPYSKGALSIPLGPAETKLLVFDEREDGEAYIPVNTAPMHEAVVSGPWEVTLHHFNGTEKEITLETLTDLKKRDDTKDFSGTITYSKILHITAVTGKAYLSLGHVNDVTELEINGKQIGTRWYGNHLYNVTGVLHKGKNQINIKVITTLGAYTKSLKNNKAAQEWSWGDLYGPTGLDKPVKILTSK